MLDLHPAIDDDELAAEALAAGDPDAPLPDGAVSVWSIDGPADGALLPEWYMPAAAGGTRLRGWRAYTAIGFVVASFLSIIASGLCNTYGELLGR